MAVVVANVAVDPVAIFNYFHGFNLELSGKAPIPGGVRVTLAPNEYVDFVGSFVFSPLSNVLPIGGTLTSIKVMKDGLLQYSVIGLTLDVQTVYSYTSPIPGAGQELKLAPIALAGNDIGTGSNFIDKLDGHNGNDTINGRAGNDIINGMNGNDTLKGGTGSDRLNGGANTDILLGEADNDTLQGGTGNDTLRGGLGNDILAGDADADILFGDAGNDILRGGAGNDQLDGGVGNDTLDGGANNDILVGGLGKDLQTGGLGNDTFRFTAATHSTVGVNADIIKDFDKSGDDRMDLSALYGPAMVFRGTGAFTAAGQVRINDIAGVDLLVEVNTGGTLAADVQIRLAATTLASMAAGDFIL